MFGRNLLAGLTSAVWSAVLSIAVIPLYLRYLGMEAYGLIGFFATLQAMFQLLDLGLTPALNREVAKCASPDDWRNARRLLYTLARVYGCCAGLIAAAVWAASPLIAGHWLHARDLSPAVVENAVVLIGLVIACRWPVGLYQSVLMGAQRMTVSSAINIAMTTASTLGAIAVLAWLAPTLQAFFLWQAAVAFTHAVLMRHAAWRAIGREAGLAFYPAALKRIWRFSAGMGGIAVLGLVLTQIDKVLLSKILDLPAYGHYMLATVVVSGLYVLVTPTFNAIYPRFANLAATGQQAQLAALYGTVTRGLASVLFPLATLLAVLARDFVQLWTGDAAIAAEVAPVIAVLAMGSALHGVVHVPHAVQLAHGVTRLPLLINSLIIVVLVPLTIVLATHLGAIGGALAWLALSVLYILLTAFLTDRHLIPHSASTWLLRDVGAPLAISLLLAAALLSLPEWSPALHFVAAIVLTVAVSALAIGLSQPLRALAFEHIVGRRRPASHVPDPTGSSSSSSPC